MSENLHLSLLLWNIRSCIPEENSINVGIPFVLDSLFTKHQRTYAQKNNLDIEKQPIATQN